MTDRITTHQNEQDEKADRDFQQKAKEFSDTMDQGDRKKNLTKYLLKRILESGEARDCSGYMKILSDDGFVKTEGIEVRSDVLKDYQRDIVKTIQDDLFASLNVREKHTIAQSFRDVEKEIILGKKLYTIDFQDDDWDEYFSKNNISIDTMVVDIKKQQEVMDKISDMLYGEPYNNLFDLQINPLQGK